ncbi:hypothetical protein AB4037_08595 [Labrys sp. KB_33_2]|uniref:hypothetical protein n=1 Tax=Labrys sp. KB_33_2 TaxID=3237479 RepID=UPI003F90EECB
MTDEVLNEGVIETPAGDDLRATITAAIEQQRAAVAETPAETPLANEQEEAKQARARDESGRFASQEKALEKPQEGKEQKAGAADAPKGDNAAPETPQEDQQAIRPPPGWSPKSKAAFDGLPPEVKADIVKREQEVNQGFAKLTEYKGLEPFAERARQARTTLEGALTNYTNWEDSFRRDPFAAVAHLASNFGIHPQQFAQGLLQRLGGGQVSTQSGDDTNPVQIHPALLQELAQLKSIVTNQESERANQHRQTVAQNVDTFFADPKNRYADNVSEIMVSLINQANTSGQKIDLPAIYETACWMHPDVRQLLINERATTPAASNAAKANAAAQARQASKAVTGAPARGETPTNAPPANESLRETIRRSIAEQRGEA